jgi:DUF3048 family protein
LIRRVPLICIVAALLLAGCGQVSTQTTASLGARALPTISPPTYLPGPLDGQSTPRSRAERRPIAVMVENYAPESRPQSGLGAASTVIETLAEAGITRFMAIYLEHDSSKVGPVRSTRVYYNSYAASFHAILAHVGGNDDAQAELWKLPKVFNIDENRWEVNLTDTGTPLFWRSQDRLPPHNMYTSTKKLRQYAQKHKQNWAYTNAYLLHKAAAPLSGRGHGSTITITFEDPLNPIPQPDYNVRYVYDRHANAYTRFMGGVPHVDADNGKVLKPANVIIVRTANAAADPAAGITPESITIPVVGHGQAVYFRDGKVQVGTWRLPNMYAPLRFYLKSGRQEAFNPGQTWIEVVPSSSPVSWSTR